MKNLFFSIIALMVVYGSYGQKSQFEKCGTDELMEYVIKNNPEIKNRIDLLDQEISDSRRAESLTTTIITIPVVFFVVHDNQSLGVGSNISDAQVISQLEVLNNYFNQHGIKFCLATKRGEGSLSAGLFNTVEQTPGILHVNNSTVTNHNAITGQQALVNTAGSSINRDSFLRIWVVKSINGLANQTLGYSMFPNSSEIFDGVVIRYDVVGSCTGCNLLNNYNQGKTLIHELGHYLALYHTFHEGCSGMDSTTCSLSGDRICDTPPVATPNFACVLGSDSCNEENNLPDSINNFMDYGNDICVDEFTPGQVGRMFYVLNNYKFQLISTDNLLYTGVCDYQNIVTASFTASSYFVCPGSNISFSPLAGNLSYSWNFGDPLSSNNTSTLATPEHIYNSSLFSPYTVTLTVTNGTQSAVFTSQIFVSDCNPIQNSEANWYFSTSNGLNFSSGIPVYNNSIPATNLISEACAVQNNSIGNTLFYTNGERVWNSSHSQINSTLLQGNVSASGGAVIVPNPANSNQYYIFTKSPFNAETNGFKFSIVNVNGATITMQTLNQSINFPSGFLTGPSGALLGGEGVAASQHCNGYWIITTAKKLTGQYILIYSLTASGLSYVSQIDLPTSIPIDSVNLVSQIEVSPNGNKITYINRGSVYLFDFNKYTGEISNRKMIFQNGTYYSGSFSPDSNLLYISEGFRLYQVQVNSVNPFLDKKLVYPNIGNQFGGFQLGPDNKIYCSILSGEQLGVIHAPNNTASTDNLNACQYTPNGPILERNLSYGLPNMIDAKLESSFNNSISSYPISCFSYKFAPNICTNSFSWNFGDPSSGSNNTSTLSNPTHTFSGAGNYTITLNTGTATITYNLTIDSIDPVILGSSVACLETSPVTNNSVALASGQTALWSVSGNGSISGLNNQSNVTVNWSSLPGTVTLTITNSTGCSSTSTKTITLQCNNNTACSSDLVFNVAQPIATQTYQASNSIILGANYALNSGSSIIMRAGNYIEMEPNTEIMAGADYLGIIEDCIFSKSQTADQNKQDLSDNHSEELSLYPNPTNDRVTISTKKVVIAKLGVSSMDGKLIMNLNVENSHSHELDLSGYQTGIYIVTIETIDGEIFRKKIIKN